LNDDVGGDVRLAGRTADRSGLKKQQEQGERVDDERAAQREHVATPRRTFDVSLERRSRAMHASVSFLHVIRTPCCARAQLQRQDRR
jgi:hypothetical protein